MNDFVLLIPYYNNYEGLLISINSIRYPADKYSILIIDDGSESELNTREIEKHKPGVSIEVIRLSQNQGIARTLNIGLKELNKRNDYKYIARLDCGDSCHPERFTEQVKFMNEHPQIALLGSWCRFIDTDSRESYIYKTKLVHKDIIKEMHFKCSFIHPTIMFRKEILDSIGYYPENYPHAEDYIFFWIILKHFTGAILPEIYVDIAINRHTVSAKNFIKQILSRAKIIRDMGTYPTLKYTGIVITYFRILIPYKLITRAKFWGYK